MNGETHKIRVDSIVLAILAFLALLYVGIVTPIGYEMMKDYGPEAEWGWPSKAFPYIHWIWTTPVGLVTAGLLAAKDRRLSKAKSSAVNFATLALFMLLGALWWYGNTVTRLIQIVH